jgi:hypothetical protein
LPVELVALVTKKVTVGPELDGALGELSSPQETPANTMISGNVRRMERLFLITRGATVSRGQWPESARASRDRTARRFVRS